MISSLQNQLTTGRAVSTSPSRRADLQLFVSSTRCLLFLCVTLMFRTPADGPCADRAHHARGAVRRRRDRRLLAFLKHERMTVARNLATIHHH